MNQLINITSSSEYLDNGILIIKEVLIQPFDGKNPDRTKIILEISNTIQEAPEVQFWEIRCHNLMYNSSNRIHEPTVRPSIKIFTHHPALWNYGNETYFSIYSRCENIPELMGDLYIEHVKTCGNWVDFHSLYSSVPETLATMRDNQLAIPNNLAEGCFNVFKKHGVEYMVNSIEERADGLKMLLFSGSFHVDDNYSSGQPYLIAKEFTERRIH